MDGEGACRERAAFHVARWGGDGLAGCVSEFLRLMPYGYRVHDGVRHRVNRQCVGGHGSHCFVHSFIRLFIHSTNHY